MTPEVFDPEAIRALRRSLGLTQAAFGTRLGVTNVTVSRWEAGAFAPDNRALAGLEALATASRGANGQHIARELPRALEFTADPNAVAAVAEAARLSFGHLASPTFATEMSLIDPLPHQRMAVYEHMLSHWPTPLPARGRCRCRQDDHDRAVHAGDALAPAGPTHPGRAARRSARQLAARNARPCSDCSSRSCAGPT